jgi:predicted nucleic acid-binding Zn ribbon protein
VSRPAPRPMSAVLEDITTTLAPATALSRIQQVWERAAGPMVSAAARPTAEREGVLTVTCSDAVWSQELDLIGAEVIERLNQALGARLVHRLRCRTG